MNKAQNNTVFKGIFICFLSLFYLIFPSLGAENTKFEQKNKQFDRFFESICIVESNNGLKIIGDGGKSIGPSQIRIEYWKDAISFDKTIGGHYRDCLNKDYSKKVFVAYLNRYGKEDLRLNNWENLSRLHNAGPRWKEKKNLTDKYWSKVSRELRKRK